MTHDPINNPSHYAEGRQFEPIDVIEDWKLNYRMGNVLKYVSRAGRKQDAIEDLKKAVWYLQREIEVLEGARPESQYVPNYDEVYEYFVNNVPYDATDSVDLWDPALGPTEPVGDYELALQEIDRYLDAPLGSPERERLEDATDFAAYYEAKHHPISPPEPMGDYQGPLYAPHPQIKETAHVDYTGQAEWDDSGKDESQLGDDDIVRIFERRGLIIGVKKGGGSVILGENNA